MTRYRALAAVAVTVIAFLLYRATLLPGVDLGDSGSFQTMVGSPLITPRDGYPLYFAIGAVVLRMTGAEPAYALNLTSALEAAIACGLFVIVASELAGSLAAAVAAATLFAVSYTFWSQSVTAEVYALHLSLVLATLLLLLRWEKRPTAGRLAAFFACYALGFGNHLSMILLMPAFVVFLFASAPRGWRSLLEPRVIALAIAFACLGALQYLWNLRTLWFQLDPPETLRAALETFWFDVTKTDWRDTMMLQVPSSMRRDHLAMYWFDLRQQFGTPVIVLAAWGAVTLATTQPRRAVLLILLYAVNFAFAFGYNVGDAHVFYLPSHLIVALLTAVGIASLSRLPAIALRASAAAASAAGDVRRENLSRRAGAVAAAALAVYAIVRGYRDFPALDRSHDRRADAMLASLTAGLDDQRAILLVDLNWQLANGLSYFTRVVRPEVAVGRMRDVLLYAPALVRDNLDAGRAVALSDRAHAILDESYGPLFPASADPASIATLSDIVRGIRPGTRFALCVLKPTRDFVLDRQDLDEAARLLTEGKLTSVPRGDYVVVAGLAGQPPALVAASDLPFARTATLDGTPVEVRMESWLSADTIRRMGFGHVIAAHRHTLIVERGVSFVAFDRDGAPIQSSYHAGLFAQPRRYIVGAAVLR